MPPPEDVPPADDLPSPTPPRYATATAHLTNCSGAIIFLFFCCIFPKKMKNMKNMNPGKLNPNRCINLHNMVQCYIKAAIHKTFVICFLFLLSNLSNVLQNVVLG